MSCGVLPAAFEAVEQSGLDFGGDVAVDLDQAVGEVARRLAWRFGDAVGDEPDLVAVSESATSGLRRRRRRHTAEAVEDKVVERGGGIGGAGALGHP
jgi:hypothetical protein